MHMNRMSVYEKDFAFLLLITKRQMLYSFLCICLGCEYSLVCEYKKMYAKTVLKDRSWLLEEHVRRFYMRWDHLTPKSELSTYWNNVKQVTQTAGMRFFHTLNLVNYRKIDFSSKNTNVLFAQGTPFYLFTVKIPFTH